MTFDRLRRTWEILGRDDPMWAVLSDPSKYNNQWDPAEFFHTGEVEIDSLLESLAAKNLEIRTGRCMDFGCGVGRLSQALARHFDSVDGVDIAQSMVDAANRYNRHGARCRYHVNPRNDLSLFETGSFDFIYSTIVLQHMETEYAERYIAEFLRVLAPGGLAVFQVPSEFHERPKATLRAHAARVTVQHVPRLEVGRRVAVLVVVENASDEAWPESAPIQVGNHWLDELGSKLVRDDGRSPLPDEMAPGDRRTIGVWVTAPTAPGRYQLEIDLVEEGVTWFGDAGSATARVAVEVTRPSPWDCLARRFRARKGPAEAIGPPDEPAVMEMHPVRKERMITIVASGGADVVDVEPSAASGPEWEAYRYVIRKR